MTRCTNSRFDRWPLYRAHILRSRHWLMRGRSLNETRLSTKRNTRIEQMKMSHAPRFESLRVYRATSPIDLPATALRLSTRACAGRVHAQLHPFHVRDVGAMSCPTNLRGLPRFENSAPPLIPPMAGARLKIRWISTFPLIVAAPPARLRRGSRGLAPRPVRAAAMGTARIRRDPWGPVVFSERNRAQSRWRKKS